MSNQQSPGDRVERPVIFLSMINSNEEIMEQLSTLLTNTGLTNNYQFIISSQPVQMVNPLDLIEQLKHIYNVAEDADPYESGITRTEIFRRLYTLVDRLSDNLNKYIQTNESNIDEIRDAVNSLIHGGNAKAVYTQGSTAVEELKTNHERLQQHAPKEGVKW